MPLQDTDVFWQVIGLNRTLCAQRPQNQQLSTTLGLQKWWFPPPSLNKREASQDLLRRENCPFLIFRNPLFITSSRAAHKQGVIRIQPRLSHSEFSLRSTSYKQHMTECFSPSKILCAWETSVVGTSSLVFCLILCIHGLVFFFTRKRLLPTL